MTHAVMNQTGIALVVTLLAVALITALVVEFSYGVYVGTSNLYNWRDSQRLSLLARSGVNVSARMLADIIGLREYSHPGYMEFPVENPSKGFPGTIMVTIQDEDAKFNLNALVPETQNIREDDQRSPYNCFKRLLNLISLDERIADRIVDWVDSDGEARLSDSERRARNSVLLSVDEVLLIPGISRDDYAKLLPYITVTEKRDNLSININGAEKPILRCLSDKISDKLAQNVIDYRRSNPFQESSQLSNVPGFERDVDIPPGVIQVKGEYFSIRSTAESGGIKRIIETVLFINRNNSGVQYWKYWKEY
jgi:general secretion pathway protein K